MTDAATRDRRPIWFAVVGAVVGIALGILVSVTTDVPFAPEAGLALVRWSAGSWSLAYVGSGCAGSK
jgi:hypothetical protein